MSRPEDPSQCDGVYVMVRIKPQSQLNIAKA